MTDDTRVPVELEKKQGELLPSALKNVMTKLRYQNYPIVLKGSSGLKAQKYISDFDLYTNILMPPKDPEKAFAEFKKIFNTITTQSATYLVKVVLFKDEDTKAKWYAGDEFSLDKFKSVYPGAKFLKADFVTYHDKRFIDLDCIYYFNKKPEPREETIRTLKEDIVDYTKKKEFYKVLKRKFRLFEESGYLDPLPSLTDVFNSQLGESYQDYNTLSAIESLLETPIYNTDPLLLREVKDSLNYLLTFYKTGMKFDSSKSENLLKDVTKMKNAIYKEINAEAKKLDKNYPVDNIPLYQSNA